MQKKQWQNETLRKDIKKASDEVATWPGWMQELKPQIDREQHAGRTPRPATTVRGRATTKKRSDEA